MKKFLLSFLAICLISINQLWAGAGIWHSNINLTLNGKTTSYKITSNETFYDNELPTSLNTTATTLSINNIRIDVWKDRNGNI